MSGSVRREVVLDREEIAATKELVTLRTDAKGRRVAVANGSDESVTILSLPALEVVREITLEGEEIRDAIFDPAGRHLYVLGRSVHVYDAEAFREITTLSSIEPMAIAVSPTGSALAVVGAEEFESGRATVVALYDGATLREVGRQPLQTDRTVQAALFASNGDALVVVASDWLAEKSLVEKPAKKLDPKAAQMRISVDFGDLVSSERICLAAASGPQILVAGSDNAAFYAERRCGASGAFTGSRRSVRTASLYGIRAWALAYDEATRSLWATDPAGFLTQYRLPLPQSR